MNTPLDPIAEATRNQNLAASPETTAWVTANAGSGKTKVLIDRVARLLLGGAQPDAVLCITYTKAAAAEMKDRLFARLGGWSTMADDKLALELSKLNNDGVRDEPLERFDAKRLRQARALFAKALETPGGIKIQTIHAFAERLLRQFPLEAGAPPGFKVVDDSIGALLRNESVRALHEAEELTAPLRAVAGRAFESDFQRLLSTALARRADIARFVEQQGDVDQALAQIRALCGARSDATPQDIMADFVRGFSLKSADAAIAALAENPGANNDRAREALQKAVRSDRDEAMFGALGAWLLTGTGTPRAQLATAAVMKDARAGTFIKAEAERFYEAYRRVQAAQLAEASCALFALAAHAVAAYGESKQKRAALDFDDLVDYAGRLLRDDAAALWIAYKLDQRVDHVLVDEAQDTAPAQWDLVRAAIAEFFAIDGPRRVLRTMFAVGDEKQSIYSFQGADPDRFLEERGQIAELAKHADAKFVGPALEVSFRSTPEILSVVDQLFDDEAIAQFAFGAGGRATHKASRFMHQGRVEWWAGAKADESGDEDAWNVPLDRDKETSAPAKLAQAIAGRIRDDLDKGLAVWDRGPDGWIERPMRPSDVMILVRKRGGLFRQILKELKRKQVPVAGADQIRLNDEPAVLDLLAIARAALLPEDDLSVAEALRTPLFGLSENDLYELAYDRDRVHVRERLRAAVKPHLIAADALLAECEERARTAPPYEFFAALLENLDSTKQSGWRRMIARLGREARESLEEMLSRALAHGQGPAPSLQRFIAEIAGDDTPVKREFDSGGDEARVMTVHGSKGLEAPIIYLPDTISGGAARDVAMFTDEETGFLWAAPELKSEVIDAAKARRDERAKAEDLRLLYVAATRARDHLIVCAALPKNRNTDASWHAKLEMAVRDAGGEDADTPFGVGLALGATPHFVGAENVTATRARAPEWAASPIAPAPSRRLAPTAAASAEIALSPLQGSIEGRFRRGALIHRLLQSLPEAPEKDRRKLAADMLATEPDLSPKQRKEILATTLAVLDHPDLSPVFAPGGVAEAAIVGWGPGLPEGVQISGRADRLIVTADEAVIVDFKTNRPAPERIEDAPQSYIAQMATYRAVLAARLKGRKVRCALVWTDGPSVMPIPDHMLDSALASLLNPDKSAVG